MDAGRRAADLLERRPELEGALSTVLDVDGRLDTWEFDDVPIDSGAFGELVSEGIVERTDNGYQLVDAEAVGRVLADGELDLEPTRGNPDPSDWVRARLSSVDSGVVLLLSGMLAFLAAVRSFVWGDVFRGEHVVLSGNDPYAYRYWVEILASGAGLDPTELANLPSGLSTGEPLLVASTAAVSGLIGGVETAGTVLAVYPVIATVITGLFLYGLTVRVTDDRRVGLSAVAMLAVTPGHALRTSLGYADHHALDYLFLVLTAYALVVLLQRAGQDRPLQARAVVPVVALALGIVGQTLAWDGAPLVMVPLVLVAVGHGLLAVRADSSPLNRAAPALAGVWLGAFLTLGAHGLLGWQRPGVVVVPLLVALGWTSVAFLGAGIQRLGRSARDLFAIEVCGAVAVGGVALAAVPSVLDPLHRGLELLVRDGSVAEAQALFSVASLGFLLVFGLFLLALALAFLIWATARLIRGDSRYLVPCMYGWFLFLLALLQVRFVGDLAPFTALFAGLGFVWMAAWVDLGDKPAHFDDGDVAFRKWRPSRPSIRTVGYVLALFALVGGIGLVQSAVKVEQITHPDGAYQATVQMNQYADERGWEGPGERYVLSRWDKNRMYNYFLNGDSRSYGWARLRFEGFLSQTDPGQAYTGIRNRVAFVVLQRRGGNPATMQGLLFGRDGGRSANYDGTGHFRTIFASEDGRFKAFALVEGAVLSGTTTPNATVSVSSTVSVPGTEFTYERRTTANATGAYTVRVSYPGEYAVNDGDGSHVVTVSNTTVRTGQQVAVVA